MPVTVTPSVLTAASPAPVQVVVAGMSSGEVYTVVGSYDGFTWPLPAGRGTSDGSTLILVDNRAPMNCDVAYVATVAGVDYTSATVNVTHDGYCVLQSLDGAVQIPCEIADPLDERTGASRSSLAEISGSSYMAGRFDRGLAPALALQVEVDTVAANLALLAMLEDGGAIVRRNDGSVTARGIPPTEIYARAGDYGSRLLGAVGALRRWSIPVQVIGDPEPGVALVAFDLDDVKTAFTGQDLDDFKAYFTGSTLEDLKTFDWGVLL